MWSKVGNRSGTVLRKQIRQVNGSRYAAVGQTWKKINSWGKSRATRSILNENEVSNDTKEDSIKAKENQLPLYSSYITQYSICTLRTVQTVLPRIAYCAANSFFINI